LDLFKPIELEEREKNEVLGTANKKILFSSSFSNPVKNYPLAKSSFFLLKNPKASLIELKDKSRNEVVKMLNACDVLLMTSYSEGSPQIIKEAMACNCPIVSTDVGDVKKNIGQSYNCFVTGFDKNDIAEKIRTVLENGNRSNGREFIMEFNNGLIIRRIFDVYNKIELATKFDSKH
jgi:teichuronic acid biosynthesis glycosyltransferase TuaC